MEAEKQVQNLNLEDILPNRFQPRIKFSEESISELANSIKEHGVIQPIVVRRIGDKYEIIAGERRYKASVLAGKETIPAIITNLDDSDSAEIALLENVQRENLTPIEEAISYKKILDMGYTQEQLAQKIGNKQSTIANKVRLLNLTDEVQEALLENKISERHARSLLKVTDPEKQILMLEQIIKGRYTVRKTDEEIEKLLKGELNMNDNNEIKITIPTSKIYEEEKTAINTTEETSFVSNNIIPETVEEKVVPVAPIPLEVEEKIEAPIVNQVVENKEPYDTKFLEKETFVNMPMHDIPEERPYGETSEFRDGKYFNIETEETPTTNNTAFSDVFKNNVDVENNSENLETPTEEIVPTMPAFDFSNSNPLENIETVSFGNDLPIAGQTVITPLTELPDIEDLAAVTDNIPTLEEMQLNLSENMPASDVISTPVEEVPAFDVISTPVEEVPAFDATPTPVEEAPSFDAIPTQVEEAPAFDAIPTQVEEAPAFDAIPTLVEETPAFDVTPTQVEEAPSFDATPAAVEEVPVFDVTPTPVEEAPAFDATPTAVEETMGEPLKSYDIPTFDPDNGTTMTATDVTVQPLSTENDNLVKEENVAVSESENLEIKLPFDTETLGELANEFIKMLGEKGYKASFDNMDFADSYKLIFTVEK